MSFIKNRDELLSENKELRADLLDILEAGLEAINTEKVLRSKVTIEGGTFCVDEVPEGGGVGFQCQFFERIFFIGIGKCAFDGARVIEDILGDKLTQGMVIDVKTGVLKRMKSFQGTHPYPSETNISITRQILEMVEDVTERDLVITLVSGGGSSLLCLPNDIDCESLSMITKELFKKGADIFELNTIRKHLSKVQGGGLAKLLFPAQVVSLIFSDVLGNDIGMIASGPTVKDDTTLEMAEKILKKYGISLPGGKGLTETPKNQRYFERVKNFLLVSNQNALVAMKEKSIELGYKTEIESDHLSGNAVEIGEWLAGCNISYGSCVLFGGETTVKIKDVVGEGGRNQELALASLSNIKRGTILASVASDGWDNTPFAGALADSFVSRRAVSLKLDTKKFLNKNDSFNFWKAVGGGAISTGRLGSNVSDLIIMLKAKSKTN